MQFANVTCVIEIRPLEFNGVCEILPQKQGDERGFFSETWNRRTFAKAGIELDFVQDNYSFSLAAGTLRGLHFQTPPRAQAKLVRVVRGAIFDVVIDIRKGSPTFRRWISLEISRERWNQVLIPVGFAHGFVTLTPETEVVYKTTDFYSQEHDRAIRFDDPEIGIVWPAALAPFRISAKDSAAPLLAEIDTGFVGP
jgi:dTDP-4-dehydrorhamnose 3,5-epimerase